MGAAVCDRWGSVNFRATDNTNLQTRNYPLYFVLVHNIQVTSVQTTESTIFILFLKDSIFQQ